MKFTKSLLRLSILLLMSGILGGCAHSKMLPFFKDVNDTLSTQNIPVYPYEPLKLVADDQIQISISSVSSEASQFFNIATATLGSASGAVASPSSQFTSVYEVTQKGMITMPVLGDIDVKGLTTNEVKEKVSTLLIPYLKDAIVSVRLVNFKVTVIGEVSGARPIPIQGERFSVVEAIGAAGGMTDFSIRSTVKILRKTDNGLEVGHVNFNNTKMMQSPFYQLHQNDIVYVEPYPNKGFRTETVSTFLPFIFTITSFLISIVLLVNRLN